MRIRVTGDFLEAKKLLAGYLADPRVGYLPVESIQDYAVNLDESENGLRIKVGDAALAWHVLPRVAELVGPFLLDLRGEEKLVHLSVPYDAAGPVVLGVLRGLMRLGKHGAPDAQGVSQYAPPPERGWWSRLLARVFSLTDA